MLSQYAVSVFYMMVGYYVCMFLEIHQNKLLIGLGIFSESIYMLLHSISCLTCCAKSWMLLEYYIVYSGKVRSMFINFKLIVALACKGYCVNFYAV